MSTLKNPTFKIKTFGCQMNHSDSERIAHYLEALGYSQVNEFTEADLILFNTCSIKQKAEDKALGYMKQMNKIRKENPNLIVGITGCMVRNSSSRYSGKRDKLFHRVRELDIALRIEELPKLADLVREVNPDFSLKAIPEEGLEDYFKIDASHSTQRQVFVPISMGCDKFCTYCIVPYSRGREKSRAMEDVYRECKELVENGAIEITLLGQTVNSYGLSIYDKVNKKFDYQKEKEPFVELLEKIDSLKEIGLKRLRFTSPHPKDLTEQLIDAMANLETMMPYLHLPVQAGDNRTLKRMNRTYTIERFLEIVDSLKEKIPDISLSTDIIVGFCGETEEEFQNTYDFFKDVCFDHAYISQYSERKGTFASKHIEDDLSPELKKERWNKMNDLLRETSLKNHQRFLNKEVKVLVEKQDGEECVGRSEHFKMVKFESRKDLVGKLVPVKITEALEWLLMGELV